MRFLGWRVLVLCLVGVLSGELAAIAQTDNNSNQGWMGQPIQETGETEAPGRPEFWPDAQQIYQDTIYLLDRVETAIVSADAKDIRIINGQITQHLISLDKFVKKYTPRANRLCLPSATVEKITDLSPKQQKIFCSIYLSREQLQPLQPFLNRQLQNLADILENKSSQFTTNRNIENTLDNSQPSLSNSIPKSANNNPVIGLNSKQPLAEYEAPVKPAIAPPEEAKLLLQKLQQKIEQNLKEFPPSVNFVTTAELKAESAKSINTVPDYELETYSKFLKIPNTGITKILPAQAYIAPPNTIQNRLALTPGDRFPFAPLLTPGQKTETNNFLPRLAMQIDNNQFQIVNKDLNYGFMIDLGAIDLDKLQLPKTENTIPDSIARIFAGKISKSLNISPTTLEFFRNYRPPNLLEELQEDRNRFIKGKLDYFSLKDSLVTQAPIVLNHTYLMRTIQYKLPDFIRNQQPLQSQQRRYLSLLLETPSKDLLIAFQPISQGSDGSYNVIWRVIGQFPDPQIQDLNKYVEFY